MSAAQVPRNRFFTGDAASVMRALPDASIDTVLTSPPYFRLRDYGVTGQVGLEHHVDDWVTAIRAVTAEAARLLVSTGTLWLNLGDAFSMHPREGGPRKSLLLAPERVALALSADGWILRNKIIWAKPSTTPSSVRDRLSTTYEVIYLLTRQPRYFFDLDSIRQPHRSRPPRPRQQAPAAVSRDAWLGPNSDDDRGLVAMHAAGLTGHPLGKNPGDVWSIPVSRFRGAHFATYPEALVERILRAACPEARCTRCLAPWRRPLRRTDSTAERLPLAATCHCAAQRQPGLVLDPFSGAGTTALVAERLQRDWLGIELNPSFVALSEQRLGQARQEAA